MPLLYFNVGSSSVIESNILNRYDENGYITLVAACQKTFSKHTHFRLKKVSVEPNTDSITLNDCVLWIELQFPDLNSTNIISNNVHKALRFVSWSTQTRRYDRDHIIEPGLYSSHLVNHNMDLDLGTLHTRQRLFRLKLRGIKTQRNNKTGPFLTQFPFLRLQVVIEYDF